MSGTPPQEICFISVSRKRPKKKRKRQRGPRTPIEPWNLQTRVAYTNAYNKLKRCAVRLGPGEDQCLHLRRTTQVKLTAVSKSATGSRVAARPMRFKHLPYKLAYLKHTERSPPKGTEISHFCGDKLCINPNHMTAESHQVNVQRHYCHEEIREWVKEQVNSGRQVSSGKHTYRTCGKTVCAHGTDNECFVMIGPRSGPKRRHQHSRPRFSQRHLVVFEGTEYTLETPRKSKRSDSDSTSSREIVFTSFPTHKVRNRNYSNKRWQSPKR